MKNIPEHLQYGMDMGVLGPVRCGGWPQGSGAETSCRELFLQRDLFALRRLSPLSWGLF